MRKWRFGHSLMRCLCCEWWWKFSVEFSWPIIPWKYQTQPKEINNIESFFYFVLLRKLYFLLVSFPYYFCNTLTCRFKPCASVGSVSINISVLQWIIIYTHEVKVSHLLNKTIPDAIHNVEYFAVLLVKWWASPACIRKKSGIEDVLRHKIAFNSPAAIAVYWCCLWKSILWAIHSDGGDWGYTPPSAQSISINNKSKEKSFWLVPMKFLKALA